MTRVSDGRGGRGADPCHTRLGKRPISVGLGGGYLLEKPEGGASWKVRAIVTLIFPK